MQSASPAATVSRLIVSRPKEGRLGTLTFDATNQVILTTEGAGPAVEELKKAWAEISARHKVSWVTTVIEETPRGQVTAIESEDYDRSHPNYFYAVMDTLSREYGVRVDIAK